MSDLELREEDERVVVEWSGEEIGFFLLDEHGAAAVGILPTAPRVACRAVLDALRARGVEAVQSRAPLFRFEARAMGFGGGLRQQLVWGSAAPAAFLDQLAVLLPDVPARILPQSALRSAWSAAVHGLRNMIRVEFEPSDGRAPLRVTLPRRDDLDAEAIACAVETALGVQARFLQASHHVRSIVFGLSSHGMASGAHSGESDHIGGAIDIHPGYAFASGHDAFMATAKARRMPGRRSGGKRRVSPAQVPAPWLPIDGVVSHEFWHKIELAEKAEDPSRGTDFRRAVGELCGAASIEKALDNTDIRTRIAREVSAYATTSSMEATAEMFMLWWCGPPPAGSLPERFGEVVERFFPR